MTILEVLIDALVVTSTDGSKNNGGCLFIIFIMILIVIAFVYFNPELLNLLV